MAEPWVRSVDGQPGDDAIVLGHEVLERPTPVRQGRVEEREDLLPSGNTRPLTDVVVVSQVNSSSRPSRSFAFVNSTQRRTTTLCSSTPMDAW